MSNHQPNQDHVINNIKEMLRGVLPTPQEQSIFKVHRQLREVNERAYEPEILSIGPYSYKNDKFKFMNEQKMRYVEQLLCRRNEMVDSYMPALIELEQQARNYYAETIDLTPEEFLAMMFIDGCFIVELLRKYAREEQSDEDDQLMESDWTQCSLPRDLLLLENQLPLVVLNKLYDLTRDPNEDPQFIDIAIEYLDDKVIQYLDSKPNETPRDMLCESKHLLHLLHMSLTFGLPKASLQNRRTKLNKFVSTATELVESGVKLRVRENCKLMDIKFENGILEIPFLLVEDDTESLFRNLIAYEQQRQSRDINYVTEYISFMDRLINSWKDVKLLRGKGIIENCLGDDEVVAGMFNKMRDHVIISDLCYGDISYNLNAYCNRKRNVWMAKLRREYLHSPWAWLSVLAAIVLRKWILCSGVFPRADLICFLWPSDR